MTKQKLKAIAPFMIMVLIVVVGLGAWIRGIDPYKLPYYSIENRFEKDFIKYLNNENEISTPNPNTSLYIWNLKKDRVKNNCTNIVLQVGVCNPNDEKDFKIQKEWTKHSVDTKRRDMEICANKVASFLESKKVSYNYNIYIVIDGDYGTQEQTGNYVYDLAKDTFWIPEYEDDIISGKVDLSDWENNYRKEGYEAYILDGKFEESNKEYSTPY